MITTMTTIMITTMTTDTTMTTTTTTGMTTITDTTMTMDMTMTTDTTMTTDMNMTTDTTMIMEAAAAMIAQLTTTANMSWCTITQPIPTKGMWRAILITATANPVILTKNTAISAGKVWPTANAGCRMLTT